MTLFKSFFMLVIISALFLIALNPVEKIYKIEIVEKNKNNALVDDFNNYANKNYWNFIESGNNYNNEIQYYSSNNINVENGFLVIEARKEDYQGHHYTSGMIDTKDKFEFLYGKVIFKAKASVGQGVLSAIWLLPADETKLPEVDIIEVLGSDNKNVWSGVHYLNNNFETAKNFTNYITHDEFSIYELDWNENEIKLYQDNQLKFRTDVGVPNKKMYLIISLAVGGDWAKEPEDNMLSAKFLIDYIMIIPKENNL